MLDNEMLIMVYETLQSMSGGVKDMKSAVQALNIKIEGINKRVSEMEGIINGVLDPGIMTIGEGHEAVHKHIYETESSLRSELRETRENLSDELRATQDALAKELREERESLNEELASAKDGFASLFGKSRRTLAADLEDIKRDHAELSARLEVYELKQQRLEQALKVKK